jgi:hypothetical protein
MAARMAIHQAKSSHAFFVGDFNQGRTEGERWLALAERAGDRTAAADELCPQPRWITGSPRALLARRPGRPPRR